MKVKQAPFLHLELGDFAKIDEVTGDYETRFIWREFETMGVNAMTPGPRELQSWKTFRDLVNAGTIPVISSNIRVRDAGGGEAALGLPYKVFTISGVRVAVFGLIGGGEFSSVPKVEGVEFAFQDPFQEAATLVPALRKKADVVVLMSQMSPQDTDRLLGSVPGIDVALYGQRASYEQNAKKVGETICNQTGIRGQYVGDLVLIVDPTGKVVDFGSRNVALDTTVPEDEAVARAVAEVNEKTKQMRSETRNQRQSEFENKLSGERFLGNDTCKRCHEKEYTQWASSPHARAYAGLEKPVDGKPRTSDCAACHVTGFGQSGGFKADPAVADAKAVPEMVNVGCESCHGMGTSHQRAGNVEIAESTCRTCHTPEWSPDFNFKTALAAVKH